MTTDNDERVRDRPSHERHLPAGSAADGPYALDIDPKLAGWDRSSLRVVELRPGGVHTLVTGESEWIILPLTGGCTVHTSGEIFELLGRKSVFSGVSDFVYVPRDAHAQISSGAGGRFALAGAKCERRLPARYGPAPEVPVELRGAGNCSRQVNNFAAADTFDCDRLIAVEVLTPAATGPRTRRTSTTSTAPAPSPSSKRSTTSRSRRTGAGPASATTACPRPGPAVRTSSPKSAAATPC